MSCSRRRFLARTGGCMAHMWMASAAFPPVMRRLWAAQERFPVVAREPFGRLEAVAEGMWALVSTPLDGHRETLCNGGIISGSDGVMVVEAFGSDAGARWMAEQARRLTGRAPTHVLVTHYHGDHTAGLRGVLGEGSARLMATEATRGLTLERNDDPPAELLAGAELVDPARAGAVDLGGRTVSVVPREGHTPSDVTVESGEPSVVWCGDLVWNGMFPNYVDAVPSRLAAAVRALRRDVPTVYVPGHGSLADDAELGRYVDLLDDVESAARAAVSAGWSAEEAGERYRIPAALGEWVLFNPAYFQRAIGTWMKELGTD